MTEAQAHEFVARWRRILVLWNAHTEAEAVRDMQLGFSWWLMVGIAVIAGGVLLVSDGLTSAWALVLIGGLILGLSLIFLLRVRQAAHSISRKS